MQVCSRKIVNLNKELPYVNIYVNKSHGELFFDPLFDYKVELLDFLRDNGIVKISPPHKKSGTRFTFRVHFVPPLQRNETAFFRYSFFLPKFKYASLSLLRKDMVNAVLEMKDYEYSSQTVNNPIEELSYELEYSKECKITPIGFDVLRGHSLFHEEYEYIVSNKLFTITKDEEGNWRFSLFRKHPPVKAKYRFRWAPNRG